MESAALIAAINGAAGLIEVLMPQVEQLVKKGQITVETQQALQARVANLRPGGTAFTGPEWQQSASTSTNTTPGN